MPEFAFGVNPFQKGSRANPFPPDLPHGQLETPITLTNPTADPVLTDYGVIPPGGSLQVPSLTNFDVGLISQGLLDSNVTHPFPQMAPVTGVVIVNAVASQISPPFVPTVNLQGNCGGSFLLNLSMVPVVGVDGVFFAVDTFTTYGQTSNSGTAEFSFMLGSTGGDPADQLSLQITIEMVLAVAHLGIDAINGAPVFSSYRTSQDPYTGLYVIDQPPTTVTTESGQTTFMSTSPNITYYSTANQDSTKPIGAIAEFLTAWVRS